MIKNGIEFENTLERGSHGTECVCVCEREREREYIDRSIRLNLPCEIEIESVVQN